MGKVIQMVVTSEDNSLFICGFDPQNNNLTFRTYRNPQNLQTEKIVIDKDIVYSNLYFFNVAFLYKFLQANNE